MASAAARSWVPVPDGSDFPLENLPFGVFTAPGREGPCVGVAIGEHVLDLAAVAEEGLLDDDSALPEGIFNGPLNQFLTLGPAVWRAVRRRVTRLLEEGDEQLREAELADRALLAQADVEMLLPVEIGDYVDFYSSIEHATNLGRMFRPDAAPLLPNWRHLPVGYHGRASTVVVSGTPVTRPCGQTAPDDSSPPEFGASRLLDIELEVGFITGVANQLGEPIPVDRAEDHIFGLVLVNDWSARDIQRWEYQPLGPFLGKSFATTISPWVVTLDALRPYRVPGPAQEPAPLDYLRRDGDRALDLHLEVELQGDVVSRTEFRGLYWDMAQQLAHATVNGAVSRAGDLFASGTVSGSEPGTEGSLIELTWRGTRPLTLSDGSTRTFLQDGDEVVLRGWCGRDGHDGSDGAPRIGFGECRGQVVPAGC